MDFDLIDPVLHWLRSNPHWAGVAAMLIAFFESLALVGLFLPGAVLMFGVGALIGADALPLLPTLAWAAVGAIAGDGVSFWLGKRFRQRIRTLWPLRTHPELLAQSVSFFHRHGGKSILFGRFVGPIRPVIPLVAGMLDMPTARFVLVNVISGLLWAPAYVLPGMVFAASLGLAAEVATRLAMLLGTLLLLLLLLLWVTRRLFDLFHRHAYAALHKALDWGQLHPRLGRLPTALLDPEHPEARGLTQLALLLLLAGIGFLLVLQGLGGTLLPNMDEAIAQALNALRTPWADHTMLTLAAPGTAVLLLPLFATVLGYLLWHRLWHATAYWLAAGLFALLFSALLRVTLQFAPFGTSLDGIPGATIHAVVLYGFLAVLLGREARETRRWWIYAAGGALAGAVAFAQVYFGAQRLSAALAALTLGLLWVALLAIAYLRHPHGRPAARPLARVALVTLALAGLWYHHSRFDADLARYAPTVTLREFPLDAWWQHAWQTLPAERADLRGRLSHPLTLQYAGDPAALRAALAGAGWQAPPPLDAVSWLQWLSTDAGAAQLPVLPQVHDGRHETLLLVKPIEGGARLLALRLWHSGYQLTPAATPLWLGNVSYLQPVRVLGTFTVPRTTGEFAAPLAQLEADIAAGPWRLKALRRADGTPLLLLRPQE